MTAARDCPTSLPASLPGLRNRHGDKNFLFSTGDTGDSGDMP